MDLPDCPPGADDYEDELAKVTSNIPTDVSHLHGGQHEFSSQSNELWPENTFDNHSFDTTVPIPQVRRTDASEVPALQTVKKIRPRKREFPFDYKIDCLIQRTLDKDKSKKLIGLEYLLEILPEVETWQPKYQCTLCSVELFKGTILPHFFNKSHQSRYLSTHFFNEFKTYTKRRSGIFLGGIIDTIICAIVGKYGRLFPVQCTSHQWNACRYAICRTIRKGKHFCEKSGSTFLDIVDQPAPYLKHITSTTGNEDNNSPKGQVQQERKKYPPPQWFPDPSKPQNVPSQNEPVPKWAEYLQALTIPLEDGSRCRAVEIRRQIANGKVMYWCYPCSAQLFYEAMARDHVNGDKHHLVLRSRKSWPMDMYNQPHLFDGIQTESGVAPVTPADVATVTSSEEFQLDFTAACDIQPTLDDIRCPLIGLEYLLEILFYTDGVPHKYYCVLCAMRFKKENLLLHFELHSHKSKYVSSHFPEIYSQYERLARKKDESDVLDSMARCIEEKFGRMKPVQCKQLHWHNYNVAICEAVMEREHFSKKPDDTFIAELKSLLPSVEYNGDAAGDADINETAPQGNSADSPSGVLVRPGRLSDGAKMEQPDGVFAEYLQGLTLLQDNGKRNRVAEIRVRNGRCVYLCFPCSFSASCQSTATAHFTSRKHKFRMLSHKTWSKQIYDYPIDALGADTEIYELPVKRAGSMDPSTSAGFTQEQPALDDCHSSEERQGQQDRKVYPPIRSFAVPGKRPDDTTRYELRTRFVQSLTLSLEDGTRGRVAEIRRRSSDGVSICWCYPCCVILSGGQIIPHFNRDKHLLVLRRLKSWPMDMYNQPHLFAGIQTEPCAAPGVTPADVATVTSSDEFQLDFTAACDIQPTLDDIRCPLIGLEYLVEILLYTDGLPNIYYCVLCSMKCMKKKFPRHLELYDHKSKYVSLHFPKLHSEYKTLTPNDSESKVLDNMARCIEEKFGRMKPVQCKQLHWHNYNVAIYEAVMKREHFSEKPDDTFIYNRFPTGDGDINNSAQGGRNDGGASFQVVNAPRTYSNERKPGLEIANYLSSLTLTLEDGTRSRVAESFSDNGKHVYLCYPCCETLMNLCTAQQHFSGKKHHRTMAIRKTWPVDLYDKHPFHAKGQNLTATFRGEFAAAKETATTAVVAQMAELQLDMTIACVIQPLLNSHEDKLAIGLEYLVEILPNMNAHPPKYYCVLCSVTMNNVMVIRHLMDMGHKRRYLDLHFPTVASAFLSLKPVDATRMLDNIARAIEKKYGRMLPVQCTQFQWHINHEAIKEAVRNREHFCEKPDLTFMELLDGPLIGNQPLIVSTAIDTTNNAEKAETKEDASPQVVIAPSQPANDTTNEEASDIAASETTQSSVEEALKQLNYYKENPENHPQYTQEWQKFRTQRYSEVKAENKDPNTYDFKSEWLRYWDNRMVEIYEEQMEKKKKALQEELEQLNKLSTRNATKRKSPNNETSPPRKIKSISKSPRRRSLSADRRSGSPVLKRSPISFHISPLRRDKYTLSPQSRSQDNTQVGRHSRSHEDVKHSASKDEPRLSNENKPFRLQEESNRSRSKSSVRSSPWRSMSEDDQDKSLQQKNNDPSLTKVAPSSQTSNHENNREMEMIKERGFQNMAEANDLVTFAKHLKNPEHHPRYYDERQKFWDSKKAQNKDPKKYDIQSEWTSYWSKRIVELYNDEMKNEETMLDKSLTRERTKHDISPPRKHNRRSQSPRRRPQTSGGRSRSPARRRRSPAPGHSSQDRRKRRTRSRSQDILRPSDTKERRHLKSREDVGRNRSKDEKKKYPQPAYSRGVVSSIALSGDPDGEGSAHAVGLDVMSLDSVRSIICLESEPRALSVEAPGPTRPELTLPVLRRLVALEDYLGPSLGPKMLDLLGKALKMEKIKPNSSESLLEEDEHTELLEMVKEKLRGKVEMGLLGSATQAVQKIISRTTALLQLVETRKEEQQMRQPAANEFAQSTTVVSVRELATLADAIIAKRRPGDARHLDTANILKENRSKKSVRDTEVSALGMLQVAYDEQNELESRKLRDGSPSPSLNAMDGLSDSELGTLMQNFKQLSPDEQDRLVHYIRKLEMRNPKRVKNLQHCVDRTSSSRRANMTYTQTKMASRRPADEDDTQSQSQRRNLNTFMESDDEDLNSLEEVLKLSVKKVTKVVTRNEIVSKNNWQSNWQENNMLESAQVPHASSKQAEVSQLFNLVQNITRRGMFNTSSIQANTPPNTDARAEHYTNDTNTTWHRQGQQNNDASGIPDSAAWTRNLQTGSLAGQGQSRTYGVMQHSHLQANDSHQFGNEYTDCYRRQQLGTHWSYQQQGQYSQKGNSSQEEYLPQYGSSSWEDQFTPKK